MLASIKLSRQTLLLLQALLADAYSWHYGYDLSRETGLKSGTLYPILIRLNERKWLETRWESPEQGRPPRHMYRLTGAGLKAARAALASTKKVARTKPIFGQAGAQ